jgi:hypothetical protein
MEIYQARKLQKLIFALPITHTLKSIQTRVLDGGLMYCVFFQLTDDEKYGYWLQKFDMFARLEMLGVRTAIYFDTKWGLFIVFVIDVD